MTRVNGTDRALLLLRERLAEAARRQTHAVTTRPIGPSDPPPLRRLRTMEAFDALDAHDQRRALVRAILAQELGDGLVNDPAFQSVADRVAAIIDATPDAAALADRAAATLRGR